VIGKVKYKILKRETTEPTDIKQITFYKGPFKQLMCALFDRSRVKFMFPPISPPIAVQYTGIRTTVICD